MDAGGYFYWNCSVDIGLKCEELEISHIERSRNVKVQFFK